MQGWRVGRGHREWEFVKLDFGICMDKAEAGTTAGKNDSLKMIVITFAQNGARVDGKVKELNKVGSDPHERCQGKMNGCGVCRNAIPVMSP